MRFIINYPAEMVEIKGLHIAKKEDVQQAIKLVEMVADYVDTGYEIGEEFEIAVSDEISILEGKLVDANLSEGVRLHPSVSKWTTETIFEMILHGLFGGGNSSGCGEPGSGCCCLGQ